MDFASIVGIISGLALIISAIFLGGQIDSFVNIPGMMIVAGGTIAATLLTFPLKDVWSATRGAFHVFGQEKQKPQDIIDLVLKLSVITRKKGILALTKVETNSPFLQRSCNLIADAAEEGMIRKTLRTEINALKARHFIVQDIFKRMAIYAPAFGMLGTLIGLIQMLAQLDNPASVGPAMAVALLTTFYGSFLATMIFLPIAGKLKARTMTEVMNLEIIFEGAISILKGESPLMINEKLSSYLPENRRRDLQRKAPQQESQADKA